MHRNNDPPFLSESSIGDNDSPLLRKSRIGVMIIHSSVISRGVMILYILGISREVMILYSSVNFMS